MKELSKDILLFENEVPNRIINTLNNLRITKEDIRFELNHYGREFSIFKNWWEKEFEPKIVKYFLQYYIPEENIFLNGDGLKEYIKFKWREMYYYRYTPESSVNSHKMLHWDFSQFTFVICLTDEYEGGELCFPRQDEHIKLKKGDLVLFPGGLTHPHYVNPTTGGVRDVLVGQILPQQQDHEIK
jgi:hypothetical protein